MAFLDDIGKVISDKSKEAASKVKDITGVIQLKAKLSAEKEKMNKAYISLGKAYYDKHEASLEEEYSEEFRLIREGLIKAAELEEEIAELEGTRVCAECGAKVEKNALYCSKCGAPMGEGAAGQTESDAKQSTEVEPYREAGNTIFAEEDSENEE